MLKAGNVKRGLRTPHLRETVEYLRHCGATEVSIRQKRRVRISWRYGQHRMAISLATTPGNMDDSISVARQLIRRRYREAGFEVGA